MLAQDLLDCRGPLQTFPSSRRQQYQQAHAGRSVELLFEASNVEVGKRGLSGRRVMGNDSGACRVEQQDDDGAEAFHPANISASTCGNAIEITTKTAALHSRMALRTLGLRLHFLARRVCQNPKTIKAIESPIR